MSEQKPDKFFWDIVDPIMAMPGVSEGTLMGFPCVHINGNFMATADHRSGDLIVKLPKTRVQALITAGEGEAFAPAGRVFKEWVKVVERDKDKWESLILEAKEFNGEK